MAFYTNGIQNIDNQGIVELPIVQSPNLPISAVAGYLLYLQDQKVLTISTGNPSDLWRSFQAVPLNYKNEVTLEQGTIGGGYNSAVGQIGSFNSISKVHFASEAALLLATSLPFGTSYGGQHSTHQYAYFHGGQGLQAAKQDWSTFTVVTLTNRPALSGNLDASLNPGKKGENTFGIVMQGASSASLTFSTDSWTSGNFNAPASFAYGVYGETHGYGMSFSSGDVYRVTWSNATWSSTGAGVSRGSGFAKGLNSKWNKWYQGGEGATVDTYSTISNTFVAQNSAPGAFQEQAGMMGQDTGFWWGYLGGFNGDSYKTDYTTNFSAVSSTRATLSYSGSAASACSGPIS
jgi:hypothetical protein